MAVDIDGTLLDSKGKLTEGTKKAIKAGVEKGLIFTICSGRPIQGVESLNQELSLDLPFITYNGAMVVMGKSREILYEKGLPQKNAREIIELGRKYNTTIIIWSDNRLFAFELNERVKDYKRISNVEPIIISDADEIIKKGITKIIWYDEPEKLKKYQNEIGKYLSDGVNYHTSRPIFLEFVDRNASKAIAMEKLGEHFGIKQSEMIAIGDGFNDLSMIEYAGLGVAMANSEAGVKEKADYITLSNDEDGVAHVIYEFVLKDHTLSKF
jgi:Cof subfamily protein (haloacid dehalogenase superfamily)